MKFLLPILFFFACHIAVSQNTQGKIVYNMEMYDEENESGGAVQILENSEMTIHFSGQNTHTSVKMGSDMEISTILNKDDQSGLLVMKGLMGDIAITGSYAQIIGEEDESGLEIEYYDQTKEILGYICKKAKLYYSNGSFGTYWYTEEIQFVKNGIENLHASLPGIPLEFKVESEGSIMTYRAQTIEKIAESEVSKWFSTTPSEGFKVISYQDFEENGF